MANIQAQDLLAHTVALQRLNEMQLAGRRTLDEKEPSRESLSFFEALEGLFGAYANLVLRQQD